MEKLTHKQLIEESSLYLDLSEGLLNKIDLFLCNTDLSNKQKEDLFKLLKLLYSEAYANALTD